MDKIIDLIKKEEARQREEVALIPSENFVSKEVLRALGSGLTNKYAEGYAGRRYYQGNRMVDEIETETVERGKKLFGVPHMNVQPYSGSPANEAVLMALVAPGEKIGGLKLSDGGHLTHGHPKITFAGRYYDPVQYRTDSEGRLDYEGIKKWAVAERPKLIFVGTTACPWIIDWKKFREIADEIGSILVADISHIAGLVVGGQHPSPVEWVEVVTSTTHKTLRGPRGAFISVTERGLKFDPEMATKIDRAVFPGLQGGPHLNNIAGIGVCFGEAETNEYKKYTLQVVKNAAALAATLKKAGLKVFGTENHLMLVAVGLKKGKEVAVALEKEGIIVNCNMVPGDEGTAMQPSGIRLGSPAMTTRGWKEKEFEEVGERIVEIIRKIG